MSFDLRPYLRRSPSDGQIYNAEGVVPEEYEDCTMEALRQTARDYGFGVPYDDHQLRELGAPGTSSGLGWPASVQAASKAFAPLAQQMAIGYPADVAAALHAYGEQGFVSHVAFWCDTNAWVPARGAVVASHAERVIWGGAGVLGFQNVWPHPDYQLSDDQVRQLYDGRGVLVVKHSLSRRRGKMLGLVRHPTDANRRDLLIVGTDRHLYHYWSEAGLPGLAHPSHEDLGGVCGTVDATWNADGSALDIVVDNPDTGSLWATTLEANRQPGPASFYELPGAALH